MSAGLLPDRAIDAVLAPPPIELPTMWGERMPRRSISASTQSA
ncbi:hypothetical protein [uncultured Microbacterium sp.]|nr:hypothetical protein [uncultured Microbacterium sp.]